MAKKKLTEKQELFCHEYAVDMNASAAYKRAGYSPKGAGENALKLLANYRIAERISELYAKRCEKADITADRVLDELARIAFSDIGNVLRIKDGQLIVYDTDELSPEVRACISSVRQTKHGLSVKLHDKPEALEKLARYLRLYDEGGADDWVEPTWVRVVFDPKNPPPELLQQQQELKPPST